MGTKPISQEETTQSDRVVTVHAGTSMEEVLRLDKEGKGLGFVLGDDFLRLDDETVKSLSRTNRLLYGQMLGVQEHYSADADKDHHSLEIGVTRGRAREMLKAVLPKGRTTRWARPENVERYRGLGYRVTPPNAAKTLLSAKGGHYEVSADGGKTGLVLMDVDATERQKRKGEEFKRNRSLLKQVLQRTDQEIIAAGGMPTDAAPKG